MSKKQDKNFINIIAAHPGGENVLNCFLCGTCTAGCPVSEIDESFSPHQIMGQIKSAMITQTLSDGEIWKCQQCHTCVAHCPQDVRFADIIRVLRRITISDGVFESELAEAVRNIDMQAQRQRLTQIKKLLGDSPKGE